MMPQKLFCCVPAKFVFVSAAIPLSYILYLQTCIYPETAGRHGLSRFSQPEPKLPEALIFVTHHKTGTSLVGCLSAAIARHLETYCSQRMTPIYINSNLTFSNAGYYLDVTKLTAELHHGEAQSPHMVLKTGTAPHETCFDTAKIMQLTTAQTKNSTPTPCWGPCPCYNGAVNCLDIGNCYSSQPMSNMLWVHVIRDPLEVVLSAYAYHMKDPPVEEWLNQLKVEQFAVSMAYAGVPRSILAALGVYNAQNANLTYWQFLHKLSEKEGLLVEFLRSSAALYKMARLCLRLMPLKGRAIVARYEDLHTDPLHALAPVLETFAQQCFTKHQPEFDNDVLKACHTGSWSEKERASHNHLAHESSEVKQRRAGLLMSRPYVRHHIVLLQNVLGYPGYDAVSSAPTSQ